MITSGELLPGQQIRQEGMAEKLGVSRLPVREALRELTADGLVTHTPNVGYSVARLSADEFQQIYLMRELLEAEVIKSLPRLTDEELAHVERLNTAVIEAADDADIAAMRVANHDFHFAIFRKSSLELVVGEIERLWRWASPYHAAYLSSPASRLQILEEHQGMIEALRRGDNQSLVELMALHREGAGKQIGPTLKQGALPIILT
ncbi:GntR family transcriptional regulator [Pseudarthrobacter sp. NPDC058329]|uniref:GntR family transcriptional regulator n=1 Tax=Pseudarthrobacter sp. NPDC058329 TaxID=3346448 RepID=UPI0036DF3F38